MAWLQTLVAATICVVWLGGLCCLPLVSAQATSAGRFQFGQAVYTTTADFGVALIAVQRHLGSDGRAAVYVSTLPTGGGNAVVGRDFRAVFNQSLLWQDGDDLDKELYIRVLNDATPQESAKSFTLYLHDATGAPLNMERSTTQIILTPPSNLASGSFRFLQAAVRVNESNTGVLELPVLWEGGTTSKARVAYAVTCETACNPVDFEIVSPPMLVWTRGGNTTQLVRIQVKDDGLFETQETFRVKLLPPSDLDPLPVDLINDPSSAFTLPPATLGNITEVSVTIAGPNNVNGGVVQFEAPCFPACSGVSYSVRDGGLVRAYLQRRNGTDGPVQARVVSVDGSARGGVDFKPVDKRITWAAGDATTQYLLVETISGVVRTKDAQFTLVLKEVQGLNGAGLSNPGAQSVTITINGPSNIIPNEVDFVRSPNPLKSVLRTPDESFFPFVTLLDSGIRVCPRLVVRSPGVVTLSLRRFFGNIAQKDASIVLKTRDDTAVGGVDYVAFPEDGQVVKWKANEDRSTIKTVTITVLEPTAYYPERRSFFVEITSVTGVALGLCHAVEVELHRVAQAPRVLGFDLDVNVGTLTLRTSVPVLAATLDPTAFTLQSDAKLPSAPTGMMAFETFQLSRQSTTASADGMSIVVTLSFNDLNAIKRFKRLAKTAATTFLTARTGAFDYVLENCISQGLTACAHAQFQGIPVTSAMAVATITLDTTRPVLLSFTMDLGLKVLKLRFSESVDSSKIRLESLGFSDTVRGIDVFYLTSSSSHVFRPNPNPLSGVLLFDANPLPADATFVTVLLGDADLNGLRAIGNGQIGLQATSTFLTVASTFVGDFASPSNPVVAILPSLVTPLLRVATADCSPCPANSFLASSCSDMKSRECKACSVCPTNSYALTTCTPLQDTVCYPCTECIGGRYTLSECSATADRVCTSCTQCTTDEFEFSPCINQQNRICRTCDSCTLSKAQQRLCNGSKRWKRRQMKAPYGCPLPDQKFQTLEAQLQRAKSNRCGAGRCSCTGNLAGNANPNGDSFPDDPRCTGPEVYGIDL